MALTAVLSATCCVPKRGLANAWETLELLKFAVIGHRGKGMNILSSSDRRMTAFKENSILSFNEAARVPVDFVELDVQVTRDGCPVVFHDNFILTELNGDMYERRVTELHLEEFLSYGPQKNHQKMGKVLHRRCRDGRTFIWNVEDDDSLCALQDVFQQVYSRLGLNIELKFNDYAVYQEEDLHRILQHVLEVFFLTDAGTEVYPDPRRNSLEEAIRLCTETGLDGIVSEVKGILSNDFLVPKIKDCHLQLLTYGQLNNFPKDVYKQHVMGIDGVILDLLEDITWAVSNFDKLAV